MQECRDLSLVPGITTIIRLEFLNLVSKYPIVRQALQKNRGVHAAQISKYVQNSEDLQSAY